MCTIDFKVKDVEILLTVATGSNAVRIVPNHNPNAKLNLKIFQLRLMEDNQLRKVNASKP